MRFENPIPLQEIAQLIDAEVVGDGATLIAGLSEMNCVEHGDLVFADHPKYIKKAIESCAGTVIVNALPESAADKPLLKSADPFESYNRLVRHFFLGERDNQSTIHPSAVIGERVVIGEGCTIYPNVTIYNDTVIGDNVIIHANTTLGADAFYYQKRHNGYQKLYSCGKLMIENNVEIGAHCTVDRGVSGVTTIGAGTKIDNHVHVGHDTKIGAHCLIAAQVGISGAVTIEDNVKIWGQVGIASKLHIGAGSEIFAQAGVMSSLVGGKTFVGSPAIEAREKMREFALLKKLRQK